MSIAVFFAIVVTWDVTAYYVMDRNTGEMLIEYQPATVSKSTLALYTFDGMAATMRMNDFLAPFTDWCGTYYAQPLSGTLPARWPRPSSLSLNRACRREKRGEHQGKLHRPLPH